MPGGVIVASKRRIITSVFDNVGGQVISDLIFFSTNISYIVVIGFIFYALVMQHEQKALKKSSVSV